jgi:hypothetical protein
MQTDTSTAGPIVRNLFFFHWESWPTDDPKNHEERDETSRQNCNEWFQRQTAIDHFNELEPKAELFTYTESMPT